MPQSSLSASETPMKFRHKAASLFIPLLHGLYRLKAALVP
jgi:hypothetical protein